MGTIQELLEARGLPVEVEGANGTACAELLPQFRLSAEGLERLVPSALAKEGAPWSSGAVKAMVRGYVVVPP